MQLPTSRVELIIVLTLIAVIIGTVIRLKWINPRKKQRNAEQS